MPGVEWGYGAMGCARWKGARLKDILDKAGLKKEAIEIGFNGADGPVTDKTPDFVKSIPVWKAIEDDTHHRLRDERRAAAASATAFPARLIVPGWTGTYWMKHVTSIQALTKPQGGFWMNPAYRIPLGKFPLVARFTSQETATNTPITEMVVNSLITSPDGRRARASGPARHDRRHRLGRRLRHQQRRSVERRRQDLAAATLGPDLGRYRLPHLELRFDAIGQRQARP